MTQFVRHNHKTKQSPKNHRKQTYTGSFIAIVLILGLFLKFIIRNCTGLQSINKRLESSTRSPQSLNSVIYQLRHEDCTNNDSSMRNYNATILQANKFTKSVLNAMDFSFKPNGHTTVRNYIDYDIEVRKGYLRQAFS